MNPYHVSPAHVGADPYASLYQGSPTGLSLSSGVLLGTLTGLAVVGGAGALAGWLIGRTVIATLSGAIVGLALPPVLSAAVSERTY